MIKKQNMKCVLLAALLLTSLTGLVHAADPIKLEPLSDPEIVANAESGAACFAAIKGKTYLYDDGGKGLVKMSGKIIKLKSLAKEGSFGTGPYISSDGGLKIAVLKNGNLEIQANGQKVVLKSNHKCGA
ncbi:MAG: hypothetical protein H6R18_1479 [Proteobacteria bacterium]|nr:hypothetical protein [Pseudomonadota bacterium]